MKKFWTLKKFWIILTVSVLVVVAAVSGVIIGVTRKSDKEVKTDILKTDIDLVKNGVSEYVVVVPYNASNYETYAKDELCLYFEEVTGVKLNVITDSKVVFDSTKKYISLGRTTVLAGSGETADVQTLTRDGYIIKRKGNTILLCGGGDYGTLYSVYGFLNYMFDWEAYTVDEIYYVKGINFKVLDFNVTDVPAIASRAGGWYVANDAYFAAKWRTIGFCQYMLFNEDMWYNFPHTTFKLVPPSTYANEHPDWYAASKKQPCFTSDGFREKLVENVKYVITQNPNLVYLPLGAEDSMEYCHCDECQSEIDKYTLCGMVVRWVNQVVEEVVEWMDEEGIERDIKFPLLAYYDTEYPPVKDGKPIDESCILHERCPVLFAPMNTFNTKYTIGDSDNNAATLSNFNNWKLCSSEMMFYLYSGNDFVSFEWADSIYTFAKNMQFAAENDVTFTFVDASNQNKQSFAFQVMTGYVFSKLQWNPYADTNELIHNFITNYFGVACEELESYYYMMKAQFKIKQVELTPDNKKDIPVAVYPNSLDYMDRVFLEQMDALLDSAIEKINNGNYTESQKEKYVSRIELESFTTKYLLLDYFSADYSAEEYLGMVDEFEELVYKHGIQYIMSKHQGITNEIKLAEWRKRKS